MTAISEEQRKAWQDLIEGVDMSHNSKKAWSPIEQINNYPKQAIVHSYVTANKVAHQLLLNSKRKNQQKEPPTWVQSNENSTWTFP